MRRITSVLSEAFVKPPPFIARLNFIVVSSTVNSPLDELWMPPPSITARLPSTITRSNVTLAPLFSTPPPSIRLRLSLTSVSRTSIWPWLSMLRPPPSAVPVFSRISVSVISTGPPSV